jgi:hypothetical protein
MEKPAPNSGDSSRSGDDLAYIAIRRHLDRYMSALDRRDFDAVGTCFTEDAAIRMHVTPGDPESGEFHRGGTAFAKVVRRLGNFKSTNHTVANALIEVNGRQATADCRVTAWLMGEIEGSDRVFLRCVHVFDDLLLTEDGWKICKRVHMPLIQFEVPASPIFLPHRNVS